MIGPDGKTVRSAWSKDTEPPRLLAVNDHRTRTCSPRRTPEKTSKIIWVKPFPEEVDITADALHVRKEVARYLVEHENTDYPVTAGSRVMATVRNPARPLAVLDRV